MPRIIHKRADHHVTGRERCRRVLDVRSPVVCVRSQNDVVVTIVIGWRGYVELDDTRLGAVVHGASITQRARLAH